MAEYDALFAFWGFPAPSSLPTRTDMAIVRPKVGYMDKCIILKRFYNQGQGIPTMNKIPKT